MICFLLMLLPLVGVEAQRPAPTGYNQILQSTAISVFADGYVEVNQTITPFQNMTLVNLPLLITQVGDVLVVDQNRSALSYETSGGNITIYTLGASWVNLSYNASALASSQGMIWTLSFDSPFNLTLTLPSHSTLLSISNPPVSTSMTNGSPSFVLNSGSWEMSYGLPVTASSTSSTTNTSGGNQQQGGVTPSQGVAGIATSTWGIIGAALVVAGVAFAVVARKKR